jgi:O-antigen/teichoic acid export membrane protein
VIAPASSEGPSEAKDGHEWQMIDERVPLPQGHLVAEMTVNHEAATGVRGSVATDGAQKCRPAMDEGQRLSDTTTQFKTQLPRNLTFQILAFVVQTGIGICLVPYLVNHLGRAAYGLIPIAGVMTQYVNLISYSISSAVTRFLTIALQRDDAQEANRIFNTAFFSYLVLSLVQIPIFALIICHAHMIFSIPEELYRDAITLLVCSAMSFLINLICSVFTVPMYANNRLDISRGIDLVRPILRLAGVVTLFISFGPALRYVGYVDLSLTILLCATYVVIARRLAPILKLAFHHFDWSKIRELTGMGGWLLVNNLGALLFLRTDVWVCNRFVGAEAGGDYAAILQWSNLLRLGGTIISGIIAPMITIYYARSEMAYLANLSRLSVRLLTLGLAIPISILCVFSSPILSLWLGPSFASLWPLMAIMLCHLVINIGVSPLFNVKTAMNKVAVPGVVTVSAGFVNLILAIFLVKGLGWGVYGVAVAGAVVLTAKNAFFMPIYGSSILRLPWHTFLTPYLSGSALLTALVVFGFIVNHWLHPTSWASLSLGCLLVGVVGLALAWLLLPKRDRRIAVDLVPSRLRNAVAGVLGV